MNKPAIVFVGGAPRSGTTLVQRLLDSHSEIVAGPEFNYLPVIHDFYEKMDQGIRSGSISHFLLSNDLNSIIDNVIIESLINQKGAKEALIVCEKTPNNIFYYDWLSQINGEYKFILVKRNPIAVINSLLKVGKKLKNKKRLNLNYSRNVVASARYVSRCIKISDKAIKKLDTDTICEVNYEDIINDPKNTLAKICSFLGVGWEKSMLDPKTNARTADLKSETKDSTWYDEKLYNRNIEKSSLDSYKYELDVGKKWYLAKKFGIQDELPNGLLAMLLGLRYLLSEKFLICLEVLFSNNFIHLFLKLLYRYSKSQRYYKKNV